MRAKRLSLPDDEKTHSWLTPLLDAYYIVDKGIQKAIEAECKKGRKPVCGRGCTSCCTTLRDIPVYPLELIGISWYAAEKVSGPQREKLKAGLQGHEENGPCPLLVDGICSTYSMRPIACRQFNVFNKPCAVDEDPYYTRREDVLPPVKKHIDQAFMIMLPFYGIEKESERIRIIKSGQVHELVKVLQACSWTSLAEKMEEHDKKQSTEQEMN